MKIKLCVWTMTAGLAGLASAVDIDVGRQLFVDDHLVATTTLKRVWHHPVKYEGNPVMKPETPWEVNAGGNATVRPNGGGMWWDEKEQLFKLWYDGVQLPDGSLVVISDYSRVKEREISFVRFSPDDVVGGRAKVVRQVISSSQKEQGK